jgi:hypothetical protein
MDGYTANQQNPFSWQNELADWTKTSGLQNYLNTGLQDSTIGQSGFFDQATAQAQALRAQNLAQVAQAIGQAPVAGIDPAQAIAAQQAQQAQALQQRQAARQGGYQTAQQNMQSTTDWINKMMSEGSQINNQMLGSVSQAVNKQQQEWQNYQQAMMQAAAQNQASQNALIGAGIGAAGTIAGTAVAGPIGGALIGGLASAGAKSAMPSGGFTAQTSAPMAVQQKYGWGQFSPSYSYS